MITTLSLKGLLQAQEASVKILNDVSSGIGIHPQNYDTLISLSSIPQGLIGQDFTPTPINIATNGLRRIIRAYPYITQNPTTGFVVLKAMLAINGLDAILSNQQIADIFGTAKFAGDIPHSVEEQIARAIKQTDLFALDQESTIVEIVADKSGKNLETIQKVFQ